MSDEFRTMIVGAPVVEFARDLAATFPLGVGMWTVPLYTGANLTHYISTGLAPAWVINNLPYTDHSGETPVTHEGDLEALAEAIGGGTTVAQLEGILAHCDISTQDWREAITRLNLTTEPQEIE